MFVATANEHNLLALSAQIAHIYVGGNIHAGQVSYVYWSVGVGQGRCYGVTLEILVFFCICHNLCVLFFFGSPEVLSEVNVKVKVNVELF